MGTKGDVHDQWGYLREDNDFMYKVNLTEIYRVIKKEQPEVPLVCKKIRRAMVDDFVLRDEINNIKKAQHLKHVIELLDAFRNTDYHYLFMPYADGGHLGQYIASMRIDYEGMKEEQLTEAQGEILKGSRTTLFQWMYCLARTVFELHCLGVRHCDIKPQNVLIKSGDVFLADFGIAFSTMEATNTGRTTTVGTAPYMPPEADTQETNGEASIKRCGMPGDIWSLGCLFYEMIYVCCLGATPHAWEFLLPGRNRDRDHIPGWISSYARYKQEQKNSAPYTLYKSMDLMKYDVFMDFVWWKMLHLEAERRANAFDVLQQFCLIEKFTPPDCCGVKSLTKLWKERWVTGVAGKATGSKASDIDPMEWEDWIRED